jgi:hypothetical protein
VTEKMTTNLLVSDETVADIHAWIASDFMHHLLHPTYGPPRPLTRAERLQRQINVIHERVAHAQAALRGDHSYCEE